MLWLLFILLGLVILAIILTLPLSIATIGYTIVILWIMLLLYIVFYQQDEMSQILRNL